MDFETILRRIIREETAPLIEEIAMLKKQTTKQSVEGYMSTAEAAKYLGYGADWVRKLANSGEIVSYSEDKKGKKRFLRADLDAYKNGQKHETPIQRASVFSIKSPKTRRGKRGLIVRSNNI